MAAQAARGSYEELARHLSGMGAVRREMVRGFPQDCPPTSAAVLALLNKYGEMRMSKLAELMWVDMSVTSRHVSHAEERGWVGRQPDPQDGRSRLLRLTEQGRRQLDTLSRTMTEALEGYLRDWTDEDIRRLNEMLGRLRGSFDDCRSRLPHQNTGTSATDHRTAQRKK